MTRNSHGSGPWRLFICHSSVDKPFVSKLVRDLRASSVTVWYDEWELRPGDSLVKKIAEGIERSSYLAIVLSPASVKSRWVAEELGTVLIRQIESGEVRILPLLYRDCVIPTFLRDRKYIDFREKYTSGLSQLVSFIRSSPRHEQLRFQVEQAANLFVSRGTQVPVTLSQECVLLWEDELKSLPSIWLLALVYAQGPDRNSRLKYEFRTILESALWKKPAKAIREISTAFRSADTDLPEDTFDDLSWPLVEQIDQLSWDSLVKLVLDESILPGFRLLVAERLGNRATEQHCMKLLKQVWSILPSDPKRCDDPRITKFEAALVGITAEWCTLCFPKVEANFVSPLVQRYYNDLDDSKEMIRRALKKIAHLGYVQLDFDSSGRLKAKGAVKITEKGLTSASHWFPWASYAKPGEKIPPKDDIIAGSLSGIVDWYRGLSTDAQECWSVGHYQFTILLLTDIFAEIETTQTQETRIWKCLLKKNRDQLLKSAISKVYAEKICNELPSFSVAEMDERRHIAAIHIYLDNIRALQRVSRLTRGMSASRWSGARSDPSFLIVNPFRRGERWSSYLFCLPIWTTSLYLRSIDEVISGKHSLTWPLVESMWDRIEKGLEYHTEYQRWPEVLALLRTEDRKEVAQWIAMRCERCIAKASNLLEFAREHIQLSQQFLNGANEVIERRISARSILS